MRATEIFPLERKICVRTSEGTPAISSAAKAVRGGSASARVTYLPQCACLPALCLCSAFPAGLPARMSEPLMPRSGARGQQRRSAKCAAPQASRAAAGAPQQLRTL